MVTGIDEVIVGLYGGCLEAMEDELLHDGTGEGQTHGKEWLLD